MRFAGVSLVLCALATAQTPPSNGPRPVDPGWHALTGGTAIVQPGRSVDHATIVIRDGRIASVRENGPVPPGARTWDCSGLMIYAAFVDPHVRVTVPREESTSAVEHWNPNVLSHRTALAVGLDPKRAATLRELGFGAAAIAPDDGIFRGIASAVSLDEPGEGESRTVLKDGVFGTIGFAPLSEPRGYPSSQMGVIALIRQTLLDAQWHQRDRSTLRPFLDELAPRKRALLFDTRDELEALRAAKILQEFELPGGLIGSGFEFRRLDAIQATGLPVIVPLAFAPAPRIESIDDRERVTLRELLTWEHAPTNPRRLIDRGIVVALTTDKVKPSKFWTQLRRAFAFGLNHDQALSALTTTPARLLGLERELGKIEPGYRANLLVVDGRIDDEEAERRSIWVDGRRFELEQPPEIDLTGRWTAALELGGAQVDRIEFRSNQAAVVHAGDAEVEAKRVRVRERQVDVTFDAEPLGGAGLVTLNGVAESTRMFGSGVAADGRRFGWSARHTGPLEDDAKSKDTDAAETTPPRLDITLPLPFGAYGLTEPPASERLIVRGATIWTSGSGGILDDGVLVADQNGKIEFVGPASALPAGTTGTTIDASGLHVTPGLIDCHSHTGISKGVNEGTQAVTAEVRIGDVVNPDDVNWYRELAGGLTAANQLHGSANPIGGQNCVVKLRWGVSHPDAMKLDGAPPGIKFALGENVKQSNWGERHTTRYPQTRMGVEGLLVDRFAAARDYAKARQRDPSTRRDLELDALAEILTGARLIHCHSYRQDEILMLCRIAEQFGFRIGTFQHGLECYKVADAVAKASRGASVFTDWWAYKFEVVDAIPSNGAILWETGVPVSFNSDSNELARRMNGEAAKATKYGGVPPSEALKFVTLAPARQLGVDDRIGSLEVSKDADFVIWSGDPLSSMTRCLATYIDGRRYWSIATDIEARKSAAAERERLIQLVLGLDETAFEEVSEPGDPTRLDELDNLPGDCGCCQEVAR
ncbi:MAG: amidohydrolase family protein [Planctomycetes bacterium]|nr:amidohydrolase family protein [Planctomycetota bacterium]